jgi:diguanylate cyclase (GGDEF)-like protein
LQEAIQLYSINDTILIVDDDIGFLESVRRMLITNNCTNVITLDDSRKIISELDRGGISVILLDWIMPHVSGAELLQEIISSHPTVPVIIMTAVTDAENIVNCIRQGAFDYITKPLDENRLLACLNKAVQVSAYEDRVQRLTAYLQDAPVARPELLRALVVDDDQIIRLLARKTLEQAGFVVEDAADGHQALEIIERGMPDLVLLDVVMPGIDGFAVCSRIRQHAHDYNTFIIMMTGLDDDNSIHRAYDAGATDFITKPINWTLLRHRTNFMMKAKQTDDQIRYLAMFDALTGLPNRSLLKDRLDQTIGLAARSGHLFAVLFIDLDLFKDVNDSFGHAIGDELLKSVAQRMSATTRSNDTLARWGGDEFVLLAQNLQSHADTDIVAQLVLKHFSEAFYVLQHEMHLSATVGIAVYPSDGATAGDLIQHADTAMNYAKKLGKNCYRFFSTEMQTKVMNRLALHHELHKEVVSPNRRICPIVV